MSRPQPEWRWISPHAVGFDGFRPHLRALCHRDRTFKDFVLTRILEIDGVGPGEAATEHDGEWNEVVKFRIGPNPKLDVGQRRAIELDYGMNRGRIEFEVRIALAYYARRQLGLDHPPASDPRQYPVVLLNPKEVEAAHAKAGLGETIKT
jgi:predicted DNA-binding transcriptional regulator YafY